MKQFKMFLALVVTLIISIPSIAQVTTSSMNGRVTDGKEPLMSATILATHTPTGTKYYGGTNADGYFRINNMRVGGPYTVEVSFVGFSTHTVKDVILKLGEPYVLNVSMREDSELLGEVVVTASSRNAVFNSGRTGAMTNVGTQQITQLPSISRGITDFTRLTPQANGNSFGGRDGRFNNITIDGGQFKNNFGLSSDLMPGGSAQPISLDAIEEVSVNVAPFDVRLSGFTGASVNAVTKSGTNDFKGTAYTFQRGKGFTGKVVDGVEIKNFSDRKEQTYGLTFGGPIIKDKLFFFFNTEFEQSSNPYSNWLPSEDGVINQTSKLARTTTADLQIMKEYLSKTYGYDAGIYNNFPSMDGKNYKVLVKLDWNINANHQASIRYNFLRNRSWSTPNYNSGAPDIKKGKTGRISENSISFSNSFYRSRNTIHGLAAELNSSFGNNMSNKLMVTYTSAEDPKRESDSMPFPFVEIFKDGDYYMNFGYEIFSYGNRVLNNTFSISDDFTWNLGKHTLLAGLGYDNIYVFNNYIREGTSYYRYDSMEAFMNNNAKPSAFGVTYGYNGEDPKGVELSYGLLAAYVQDEYAISPQFKLTAGIRLELPMYHSKLTNNPLIDNLPKLRYDHKLDVSTWPNSQLIVNPRIGFNWDILGDRSIQMRGGTGVFTGSLPFVWFTNQPTASGTAQSPEMGIEGKNLPSDFRFNPDFREQQKKYPNLFPNAFTDLTQLPKGSALAQVDKNFKMPQVWRSNIAVDFALPGKTTLTLEGIYTKDINAPLQKNLVLREPTGKLADGRPYYGTRLWDTQGQVSSAILLTNTNKGYQGSFTVQLRNRGVKGLDAMVAYTYSVAKDVTSNPGSQANSAWVNNHTYADINDPELGFSQFAVPHRVIGSLSYRFDYGNIAATTIGVYYNGSHQGRASAIYAYDINNDGVSGDLINVPEDASTMNFVDVVDRKTKQVVMSAKEQQEAYMEFINGNKYLSSRKGNFAERFAILEPWLNRFDVKLMQEFYSNFGSDRRYTVQLSLDIINAGNMLKSSWGTYKRMGLADKYGNIKPLTTLKGGGENPKIQLNAKSIEDFKAKSQWIHNSSVASTWGMLLGVKLIF